VRLSRRARPAAAATLAAAVVLSLAPAVTAHAATSDRSWVPTGHGELIPTLTRSATGQPTSPRVITTARASRPHAASVMTVSYTGATGTIVTVNYDTSSGFASNTDAVASFGEAAKTWADRLTSSIPIVVDATLFAPNPADPGVLGAAGPTTFVASPNSTLYPVALANAILKKDNAAGMSDIQAEFVNDPNTFYYGTDPAGLATATCSGARGDCYDFESVVLHELGHGLGFIGSLSQDYDAGGTALTTASWGTPAAGAVPRDDRPYIFDLFTGTGAGDSIVDTGSSPVYANHSAALLGAITNNSDYWYGGFGSSADRGREPRLYAPEGYQSGSSFSHLSDLSYPNGDADGLMTPYAEPGVTTRLPGQVVLGMFRDLGWTTADLPGARYTPLAPVRVLDTAKTSPNKLGAGAIRDVQIGGLYGVPRNATAVVLNVTAALPSATSVLKVYPVPRTEGAPVPDSTNLNTGTGDNRANLVTVPLGLIGPLTGTTGRVRFSNAGGATRLVVDLAGYYAPSSTQYFHTVAPVRLMDTRTGTGVRRGGVPAGGTVNLKVAGVQGVPAGATAVVMTLTAITPSTSSYVSVYPYGTAQSTSSINLKAGAVAANQVIVKVGTGGYVTFKNFSGAINLAADLAGWYDTDAVGGGRYRPTLPERAYDSGDANQTFLGSGATKSWFLVDAANGVPPSATAAVFNVTGYNATAGTYLTAFPLGAAKPTASNDNLAKGQTAAALATVQLGSVGPDRGISLNNFAGNVTAHVDLQGWFGP
jgi:hypothetical protein